ncbi:C2H2 finger domain-containing protein [Zalerion maritima]|uniref:C2H2 finger domain-containing protein n=1 Tax=Zalerion maritima TaxID=339359 RepID=A0AAD5RT28_9PEZI|nr:C2H2 finger domain-containing protein [Zalerion maritima]
MKVSYSPGCSISKRRPKNLTEPQSASANHSACVKQLNAIKEKLSLIKAPNEQFDEEFEANKAVEDIERQLAGIGFADDTDAETVQTPVPALSICLSSRHYPHARMKNALQFRLGKTIRECDGGGQPFSNCRPSRRPATLGGRARAHRDQFYSAAMSHTRPVVRQLWLLRATQRTWRAARKPKQPISGAALCLGWATLMAAAAQARIGTSLFASVFCKDEIPVRLPPSRSCDGPRSLLLPAMCRNTTMMLTLIKWNPQDHKIRRDCHAERSQRPLRHET